MDTRTRIIDAAAKLLRDGGPAVVSTRAVSAAAGVHAPAIYRLVGDKDDLMSAVAAHALEDYLATKKTMEPSGDPIEDLREGWRLHVGFGLENPDVYAAVYGSPRNTPVPAVEAASDAILLGLILGLAEAGLLSVPPRRAVQLVHVAGRGTIFTLMRTPDPDDLVDAAFEMLLAAITIRPSDDLRPEVDPPRQAAITLAASLDELDELSAAERLLLREWLERIQHGAGVKHN